MIKTENEIAACSQYNLASLFELVAQAIPQRQALVAGSSRLTYQQLDDRAGRLGAHLLEVNVQPGQHVAILAWNRAEWVESMLACFKIRAVPVNVNYRYVDSEIRHLLSDSQAVAVIAERSFVPTIDRLWAELPALRHLVVIEDAGSAPVGGAGVAYEESLASADPAASIMPRSSDDHYLLYTGGTTGMPKGVLWRSEDIFFAALQGGHPGGEPIQRPGEIVKHLVGEPRPWLVTSPLMHGNGQWNTLTPLLSGRGAILWTQHKYDPAGVAELAAIEGPELLVLIGDGMARPFADTLSKQSHSWDLSTLRFISSGGATLSPIVKRELKRSLPDVVVLDGFGSSETGANGVAIGNGENGAAKFRVGAGTTVVDDELRPMSPGTGRAGRLARTGRIPLAYWNDPAKTAATFPIGPDGTRWAIPGDRAVLEVDGTITLLGRGSMCINTGGEKVYPHEVEGVLMAHPAIADAVVVGMPHERFGQQVAAVAVSRTAPAPALDTLRDDLRHQLAAYKLPRRLVLVDAIRRTAAGKPDYVWAREVLRNSTDPEVALDPKAGSATQPGVST
ncbi:hypothetical protein BST36_14725 [Mycolicibacterium moriokaense]|uniref:Fatty-acyl-CoA synthase n=1 Tax=Mycolicibacterium moriokaense TaxID=39691 RepID=A0AAD1M4E4_9MYCO|nr:acyl-CoA synthetase [Mycolicibacterium moriokaense]MCV7037853.1 acyl-CoA synthetase [Mycolicibacterium moriokaense]ORB22170.1 hypothetical protein BST36_14725 [Mycolicibacterium moriokaense]BBW99204.1 fatty-acyl-CoA synthase [Mycolicibacterium moriokaense]